MHTLLMTLDTGWTLTMAENAEVNATHFCPTTAKELSRGGYPTYRASVPGNFELDLWRAGVVPDLFYGQAPYEMQKYENRHLYYLTTFTTDFDADEYTYLSFGGIDTVADIYLDGTFLAHTENMLIPYEFAVSQMKKGKHELLVHIHPFSIYARRYSLSPANITYTENMAAIPVRKAPYMMGWDIMPRFVSGGLWKPVQLIQKKKTGFDEVYLYTCDTDAEKKTAYLRFFAAFHTDADFTDDLKITVEGECGDSRFQTEVIPYFTAVNTGLWLNNVRLWYPKNAGNQPLYRVSVKLFRKGTLLDEYTCRIGIRKVVLERTSTVDKDGNGEFVFRINGKRVFFLGTNWVPLDPFPSRHGERLPTALALLNDIGCNAVRCWGGNVYENDAFYDYCDENGIAVWQDFSMACAYYPQDERFLSLIREEAEAVVKRLRQHPSIVLYAGDNECDSGIYYNAAGNYNPNGNRITREILPDVCRNTDVTRPYLPSSPYIDEKAFLNINAISENHLWGPRDYFKGRFYTDSVCCFASETGYHGCPSPASLRRYIRKEHLYPNITDGKTDVDWLLHASNVRPTEDAPYAYRIGLMSRQVETLFGYVPDNLADYARMSQISQAEAVKYFIERFRIGKWRRTGILWWNLIDGCPQISDAVIDYYGVKKLAYHFIRRSQAPVTMMFDEPKGGRLTLYAVNDTETSRRLSYTVTDMQTGEILISETATAPSDSATAVHSIPVSDRERILHIAFTDECGNTGANHYTEKTENISFTGYMEQLRKMAFDRFEGFDE